MSLTDRAPRRHSVSTRPPQRRPDPARRPAAWYADYAANPHTDFSPERLVGYVLDAPATSGYRDSNTNYVLAEMIIERVTGDSYQDQLYRRVIEPLGLCDLHYRPDVYPAWVTDREPAGYFFNLVFPMSQLSDGTPAGTRCPGRAPPAPSSAR